MASLSEALHPAERPTGPRGYAVAVTPDRDRHTRHEIKEGRPARQEADRLASEANRMERRTEKLGAEIEQARADWRRKRADQNIPGANPPDDEGEAPEGSAQDGGEETQGNGSAQGEAPKD